MKGRRWAVLAAVLSVGVGISACTHSLQITCSDEVDSCPHQAKVCTEPTMMALAEDLDHLERHIEKYGSVVAKVPDVWGQARLTKHREEFEDQMRTNLTTFQETLQGSMARTDQAYFANAMALSAAISGPVATQTIPAGTLIPNSTTVTTGETRQVIGIPNNPGIGLVTGVDEQNKPVSSDLLNPNFFTPAKGISVANFSQSIRTGTGAASSLAISLEPTIVLDQKARYLNHLNELRRINEGDDTADSPGYSLNLVRIPISVLPGKQTDKGYGAEITMTLTPHLGEELLPMTFRNLMVNDVTEHLAFPFTAITNDPELRDQLKPASDEIKENKSSASSPQGLGDTRQPAPGSSGNVAPPGDQLHSLPIPKPVGSQVQKPTQPLENKKANSFVGRAIEKGALKSIPLPAGTNRRARRPFPANEMGAIYGTEYVVDIGHAIASAFERELAEKNVVHLTDIQSFLLEQTQAAHRFLSTPAMHGAWLLCDPCLAEAIQAHRYDIVDLKRAQFNSIVETTTWPVGKDKSEASRLRNALAWAILVEAALLNDHFVKDMRETASSRGTPTPPGVWLPYFLPNPPPEARQAFNAYVQARWPIHVFALDPVTQDQNLGDSFRSRREMQLALSMAFVTGNISTRNMTRYARRLELDMETIALNRTAVGFSHGTDTFGWRFYPRYQTPDTESNATVLFRDMLWGGPSKDALLRQRRLEPGMRECLAIVIMPSFVPFATLETSSSWFKLTNPKHKEMDHTDAMKLSRTVKTIQNCAGNVQDAACYRDGDWQRLWRRVEQLSARLPMQTLQAQVPFENTLGGFEMFSTGITDLAPELIGWYGEPGINLDKQTTLFLVGNHFSVHHTKVIVGGTLIIDTDARLLSREVMRVTIPAGVNTVNGMVDIHVATPYGVSQHLLVPAFPGAKKAEAASYGYELDLKETNVTILYTLLQRQEEKTYEPRLLSLAPPPAITIRWNEPTGSVLKKAKVKFEFDVPKPLRAEIKGELTAQGGKMVMKDDPLKTLSEKLLKTLHGVDLAGVKAGNSLPASIATGTILITPEDEPAHDEKEIKVSNALTVQLVRVPLLPQLKEEYLVAGTAQWQPSVGMTPGEIRGFTPIPNSDVLMDWALSERSAHVVFEVPGFKPSKLFAVNKNASNQLVVPPDVVSSLLNSLKEQFEEKLTQMGREGKFNQQKTTVQFAVNVLVRPVDTGFSAITASTPLYFKVEVTQQVPPQP